MMARYNYKKCEVEEDARRMAETILRELGYYQVNSGPNIYNVNGKLTFSQLQEIAVNSERISRWARNELKGHKGR